MVKKKEPGWFIFLEDISESKNLLPFEVVIKIKRGEEDWSFPCVEVPVKGINKGIPSLTERSPDVFDWEHMDSKNFFSNFPYVEEDELETFSMLYGEKQAVLLENVVYSLLTVYKNLWQDK